MIVGGTLAPDSVNGAQINFQQINVYDPWQSDATYGTQQPLGWDQWVSLYNRCKVIGGRISTTFHNAGASSVIVGVLREKEHETDNATSNPWQYICERPAMRYRLLTPDVDKITINHGWSTKKNFNVKDLKDSSDFELKLDDVTPAPLRDAQMTIYASRHNGTGTNNVEFVAKITWLCLFYDPKIPARSAQ